MAEIIQMGRKHCGKGEIAHYEQFLLFPQCFQKTCFPGASKGVTERECVNQSKSHILSFVKSEIMLSIFKMNSKQVDKIWII